MANLTAVKTGSPLTSRITSTTRSPSANADISSADEADASAAAACQESAGGSESIAPAGAMPKAENDRAKLVTAIRKMELRERTASSLASLKSMSLPFLA